MPYETTHNPDNAIERKIAELEARKKIEPYYLTKEQMDALRLEVQAVNPERQKDYAEIERRVGQKFVDLYGAYLTPAQREYMASAMAMVADPEDMNRFVEFWNNKAIRDQNKIKSSLHGLMYRRYMPKHLMGKKAKPRETYGAMQLWAGRIPLMPAYGEVNAEMLMGKKEFDKKFPDFESALKNLDPWFYSVSWGSMVLHEKVHGIHDYDLPFPIIEIAAYYYENTVLKQAGWYERTTDFKEAIRYWDTLVQELGEDLHRFIFGNLPESRREEVRAILQSRLTPEVLANITPETYWETDIPKR